LIAPARLARHAPRLLLAELLGLPLAALLALACALWGFAALAEDYVTGDPIIRLDHRLANGLHDHAAEPLTTIMRVVTDLGGAILLSALCLAAYTLLTRRGKRPLGAFVVGAFLGAQLLTAALKVGFRRDRPVFDEPLASAGAYSFPSGHALVSLVVYGALAYVLATSLRSPLARIACFVAATLLVLAIGFSRLYLGLHYLSDVLAGFSAGTAWLLVCIATYRSWTQRRARPIGGEHRQ
jgi:membrane-associated phospholipid phosphatase